MKTINGIAIFEFLLPQPMSVASSNRNLTIKVSLLRRNTHEILQSWSTVITGVYYFTWHRGHGSFIREQVVSTVIIESINVFPLPEFPCHVWCYREMTSACRTTNHLDMKKCLFYGRAGTHCIFTAAIQSMDQSIDTLWKWQLYLVQHLKKQNFARTCEKLAVDAKIQEKMHYGGYDPTLLVVREGGGVKFPGKSVM